MSIGNINNLSNGDLMSQMQLQGGLQGLNSMPIGGFAPTTGSSDSFESLFSSLSSNGSLGPNLYSTTSPAANSSAMSIASESATSLTNLFLNKIAPLNLPAEALYSSSVFGNQTSGMSILDAISQMVGGIAGILPLEGKATQFAQVLSPAIGALNGLFGTIQGLKFVSKISPIFAESSEAAIDEYNQEEIL